MSTIQSINHKTSDIFSSFKKPLDVLSSKISNFFRSIFSKGSQATVTPTDNIKPTQPPSSKTKKSHTALSTSPAIASIIISPSKLDQALTQLELESVHQNPEEINREIHVIHQCDLQELKSQASRIKNLFFNTLIDTLYDRSLIQKESALEKILDPEVFSSHTATDTLDLTTKRRIDETCREAQFSFSLGVKPEELEERKQKTYWLKDRDQKYLGIFKQNIPESQSKEFEDYGASDRADSHLAEVAASRLDSSLEIGIVPFTTSFRLNGEEGTLQFFIENGRSLCSKLDVSGGSLWDTTTNLKTTLNTPWNQSLDFVNFEEFSLLDMMLGDNDRHFDNALLTSNSKGNLTLIAIDNGNSFPSLHNKELPPSRKIPVNTYKWMALPQAKKPYSPKTIIWFQTLDFDKAKKVIREQYRDHHHGEDKVRTFEDRIRKLQELINSGASIAHIAQAVIDIPSNMNENTFFRFHSTA